MKKKPVVPEPLNLPKLTPEQRMALVNMMAPAPKEFEPSPTLGAREGGSLYRPVKRQITVRIDADVLEWLRAQGKGYQSRINAILRREMLRAAERRGA